MRSKKEETFYYAHPGLYNKVIREINLTKDRVAWLLEKYPHLRGCDKCLIFNFWIVSDNYNLSLKKDHIHNLTGSATILRVRRYLQNELNLFLPEEDYVRKARGISEQAFKEWSGKN